MTVIIKVGRRVPKSWFKRTAVKAKGLISFQENIWIIISQSFKTARSKANSTNSDLKINIIKDIENEDLHYQLEWMKVIIQGNEKEEKEEFEEANMLYKNIEKHMKKELPKDGTMSKHFKTKILSNEQIQDAYKKGYGVAQNTNMSNKLLEMGILTHIEWKKDFNERIEEF